MLVVTLTGADVQACREEARRVAERLALAPPGCTAALELRLDLLDEPATGLDLVGALELPVVVTVRSRGQGGRFDGTIRDQSDLLGAAARAGAAWLDLEAGIPVEARRARRLLSWHDFDGDASEALSRAEALLDGDGDHVKLALSATTAGEMTALRELLRRGGDRLTAFSMGELGLISRWSPLVEGRMDEALLYVTAGEPVAPGQPDLDEFLRRAPRFAGTSQGTCLGLLGWPTSHSLSPAAFEAGLAATGEPFLYLPFPMERLDGLREFLDAWDVAGVSVTAPHKVGVIDHLDTLGPLAEAAGSVNTVTRARDGRLHGENLDVVGVREPVREAGRRAGVVLPVERGLVVGSGGAARAAVVALRDLTQEVVIRARRPEAAAELAASLGATVESEPGSRYDIVVHATPAGGPGDPDGRPPIDVSRDLAGSSAVVLDMNYRPHPTGLLSEVAGVAVPVGGVEMFVTQALEQWRRFVPGRPRGERALEREVRRSVAPAGERHVVLVGFRGSGKSSLTPRLAGRLGLEPADTDAIFVEEEGMTIAEFFSKHGEDRFRIRETAILAEVMKGERRVIATGGGVPLDPANRRRLSEELVIFLDVDADEAIRRLDDPSGRRHRPALTDSSWEEEVARLIRQRRPLYAACSDIRVDAGAPLEDLVREIVVALERYGVDTA